MFVVWAFSGCWRCHQGPWWL